MPTEPSAKLRGLRVLIVGAGAVGQVYGKILHDGGAEVAFLVKEKYAAETRQGFVFYPRRTARRGAALKSERWTGFEVLTKPYGDFDCVILSVSSTALYAGDWVAELVTAMGNATLVMLQPGLNDREFILSKLGPAKAGHLVEGTINVVAYHAPMPAMGGRPAETHPEPGMAYWFPPGPMKFSGDPLRLAPLFAALRRGGLPVAASPDLQKENVIGMPELTVLVCALEASGWSFDRLLGGPNLELASRATEEAIEVFARLRGAKLPPAPVRHLVTRPAFIRTLVRGSKYVVPFDFETYLQVHFTKVREQMHQGLRDFVTHGSKFDVRTTAIDQLLSQLGR
jgi:2-dehydropantoate 2-reductase